MLEVQPVLAGNISLEGIPSSSACIAWRYRIATLILDDKEEKFEHNSMFFLVSSAEPLPSLLHPVQTGQCLVRNLFCRFFRCRAGEQANR